MRGVLSVVALVLMASCALADTLILRNGDRLKGTFIKEEKGVIHFNSEALGLLKIPKMEAKVEPEPKTEAPKPKLTPPPIPPPPPPPPTPPAPPPPPPKPPAKPWAFDAALIERELMQSIEPYSEPLHHAFIAADDASDALSFRNAFRINRAPKTSIANPEVPLSSAEFERLPRMTRLVRKLKVFVASLKPENSAGNLKLEQRKEEDAEKTSRTRAEFILKQKKEFLSNWKRELTIGIDYINGNNTASRESFLLKLKGTKNEGDNRYNLDSLLDYREEENAAGEQFTRRKRVQASFKHDYYLTARQFVGYGLGMERDRVRLLDSEVSASLRLGYDFSKIENLLISATVGLLQKRLKFESMSPQFESYGTFGMESNYEFTKQFHFKQSLKYESQLHQTENYTWKFEAAFIWKADNWVDFGLRYINEYKNENNAEPYRVKIFLFTIGIPF